MPLDSRERTASGAIGAPRLPADLVPRAGVRRWLDGHSSTPVRVVSGLSGSGRTSALLDWAVRAEPAARIIWVGLDSELAERRAFWTAMIRMLPRVGVAVDAEFADAVARLSEGEAGAFTAHLMQQCALVPDGLTVVIDDAHLAFDGALADDLVRVVRHAPAVRVVLSTRTAPGSTAVEAALPGLCEVMDPVLLAFSPREIEQFARETGRRISPQRAAALRRVTGGWPAAVRAELRPPLHRAGEVAAQAEPREIGAATRELGARLLGELRPHEGFGSLLRLAMADAIDDEVLRRLDAPSEAGALLDRIVANGLGWREPGDGVDRLRLHTPLRVALVDELERTDPDGARRTARVLVACYESRGESVLAFAAAVRAADWESAARHFRFQLLEITSRSPERGAAVQSIPRDVVRRVPMLRFAVALDDFAAGRTARAAGRFLALLTEVQGRRLRPGARPTVDDVWIQGARMVALRLLGRFERAVAASKRLPAMADALDDPDGELERAASMMLSQRVTTLVLADRLDEARAELAEAGADPRDIGPVRDRARVLAMRAFVTAVRGEMPRAGESLARLADLGLPPGYAASYAALPAHIARALMLVEHDDAAGADASLSRGDEHWPTTELWPYVLMGRVRARGRLSGAAAALELLDDGLAQRAERTPPSAQLGGLLAAMRVDLLLDMGQISPARDVVARAGRRGRAQLAIAAARARLLTGDAAGAATDAGGALRTESVPRRRAELATIAASAHLRLGQRDLATQHIERAVEIARRNDLRSPFSTIPRADAEDLLPGEIWRRVGSLRYPPEPVTVPRLTERERVVLAELSQRRTIAQIAAVLVVSENTVKTQVRSLYRKLGARDRASALEAARGAHLI
ncbi:LuxR C-terminal-related transcriptional regulator [Microbacterium karelineae]|uniref:LuxR C-terminal-related transcriptional regulator n=1 Tax=Microbacterium karelineae TaxID=2654283 RepID=UPI0012EAADD4|nr:LuxR C-terminal-related transcriptional regulator [Microbacterium karelineae]